jgi:hypothetical protein
LAVKLHILNAANFSVRQPIDVVEGTDFIAVRFSDEQESVLFLPCSGEVLVSSSEAVAKLGSPECYPAQPLQQMLSILGVEIG